MHLDTAALHAGLDHIRRAPDDGGALQLIVARPTVGERSELKEGILDTERGLIGDSWIDRPSRRTDDGLAHPDMQLNIMNARAIALIAGTPARWSLAGDQLYIDINLADENLPAGTQLALGAAIIEITDQPHTGCKKFSERFGLDAVRFVNSPAGSELKLRGINARVVQTGSVSVGDRVTKLQA